VNNLRLKLAIEAGSATDIKADTPATVPEVVVAPKAADRRVDIGRV